MKNEDIKVVDNQDNSEMEENRQALSTESEITWIKGDFRNRLIKDNFVLVLFSILIMLFFVILEVWGVKFTP